MKLKMVIEFEYNPSLTHADDKEAIDWFYNDILMGKSVEGLELFSEEIGDFIGSVTVKEIEKIQC